MLERDHLPSLFFLPSTKDFVEGVERIISASSANDVATNPQYNKVVLKRVVKEFDGKDMRKT